ncbi:hypothetical protein [Leucobacter komagatae]
MYLVTREQLIILQARYHY